MLKSVTTALVGIVFGVLATAALGVSPSAGQQLKTSIPCQPIVKDWTVCKAGRLRTCRLFVGHNYNGRCVRYERCTVRSSRPC